MQTKSHKTLEFVIMDYWSDPTVLEYKEQQTSITLNDKQADTAHK